MKLINLTGERFGHLRVLGREGTSLDGNHSMWRCLCDCGRETIIRSISLRCGDTKACGCFRGKAQRLRPYEALYKRMVRDATRLRGIDVELTYEQFVEFTNEKYCFYCGASVEWKYFSSANYGYNLDRKDNDRGYAKDNLAVCCKRCNLGKRDTFTFDEWFGMTAYFRDDVCFR